MPVPVGAARCRFSNDRAFTLIELIVVMALMALIASFAMPRIGDFFYADQLKVTVRKLVGLIHRSSQLAQRHQLPYVLAYRPGERLFVARPEERAGAGATDTPREDRLSLAGTVTVRDLWSWYGGLHDEEAVVIRFNKNGYVEPTVIHLREEDGQEMSVILTPFLGKVKVVDGYVLPETEALFQ
ncbi:pilus assembly FimT family protein [Desulfobulbus elongatus]|uniref:pilus assembly FimT family protein n=1 Tax=Desulfobulbus elongatus TaxID=53332 RepID=UPI000487DC6E|nr:type II secretion system protein [Desulfobulbus elongatus]